MSFLHFFLFCPIILSYFQFLLMRAEALSLRHMVPNFGYTLKSLGGFSVLFMGPYLRSIESECLEGSGNLLFKTISAEISVAGGSVLGNH